MFTRALKAAFIVWVLLWAWFTFRELFVKGKFECYRTLLSRSYEGKHSYVAGDRLYEFVMFCDQRLPKDASYDIKGLVRDKGLLDMNRAVYYLYPRIRRPDSAYILVYDEDMPAPDGYKLFDGLDSKRYILRRP
jgi:hypothetical protein